MQDLVSELVDGEAEILIEDEFAELIYLFPRQTLLSQLASVRAALRYHERSYVEVFPHRPVRLGTANHQERRSTDHTVVSLFEQQEDWLRQLHCLQWRTQVQPQQFNSAFSDCAPFQRPSPPG